MLAHFCLFYFFMCVQIKRENKLSCNQPAQQALLCGLGAKNQEQESKTARKMAQVKEWERGCPSPAPPPFFIFWFSFYFSRGQNRKSPSTVFFCSETKRKRVLRRLSCNRMGKSVFVFHVTWKVMLNCLVLLTYNSFLAVSLKHYGGSQFFFNLQENVMTPALNS